MKPPQFFRQFTSDSLVNKTTKECPSVVSQVIAVIEEEAIPGLLLKLESANSIEALLAAFTAKGVQAQQPEESIEEIPMSTPDFSSRSTCGTTRDHAHALNSRLQI
jgi:hypothetical protein